MSHIASSVVLFPSGEMHFFDISQSGAGIVGSAINADFPHPDESGIYKTHPADLDLVEKTGVFHYNNLERVFSNAPESRMVSITDFTIYNPYMHHEGGVSIPYVSDATPVSITSPYGL